MSKIYTPDPEFAHVPPLPKGAFNFFDQTIEGKRYPFPAARDASSMLQGPQMEYLLYGGAGSAKTVVLTRATAIRAMLKPNTTHAILRFRFNHLKASIINDTFPFIMKTEFPHVQWELNKSDWFVRFPWNESLIYYGGLDEKERTEKILGQGHSTIYLNEISQISYAARQKARTRLRQNRGLRLRMFYDCNPPGQGHWSYKLFVKGIDPEKGLPLSGDMRALMRYRMMHPKDNPFLPPEYLFLLENLAGKDKLRFWDGEFAPAVDSALWTYEQVENVHLPDDYILPVMQRVIVAVDPSGCHGPDDKRSDEVGIVVVGLGMDNRCYVLEDASDRYAPGGPDGWGQKVVTLYKRWRADMVVAEANFGGAMVQNTIGTIDKNVPFKEVHASRGKAVRAEPVSALYAAGRVYHRVPFPEMEEQMCNFATNGYQGQKSPDRADAMIWGVSDLLVGDMPGFGLLEFYERQAADAAKNANVPPPLDIGWQMSGDRVAVQIAEDTEQLVTMMRPPNGPSVVYGTRGQKYVVGSDNLIRVIPDDVIPLMRGGFIKQQGAVQ
jgi:phage terminase large subunit-like protein